MRRALAIPAGVGLLLLAFGVAYSTPDDRVIEAPFAETGAIGDQIVSQHLVATVHEASLADVVELRSWTGTTAGVWLVIDATVEARLERSLAMANVFLDGARYPATGRAGSATVDGGVVDAGFPESGPILVELPADVLERPGSRRVVLRLGDGVDVRLDSVIEVTIDLTALEHRDRVVLDPRIDGAR